MNTIFRSIAGGVAAAGLAVSGACIAPQQASAAGVNGVVVAIGDSYPAGSMGARHAAYPEWTASWTSTRTHRVGTTNLAQGGWTTKDVLYQFDHTDALKRIATAETVIITIGANDILNAHEDPRPAAKTMWGFKPQVNQAATNLDRILARVKAARHGNVKRVVVADYNTVYRQGGAARWAGKTYMTGDSMITRTLNGKMMAACKHYGMTCVDVFPYFQGSNSYVDSLVTSDGAHPSIKGHQLYARRIVATLPRR